MLNINCHVLSGGNHDGMLVERVNRYLNKGLKILTNERGSVRVAMESILLLLYAWNSCPVPGTDISRSMVAVGREFAFPIDFSTNEHFVTHSAPGTVTTYAQDLAGRLSTCRDIAQLLVQEHRSWHRELVNSRRPDPRIYSIGDIVFARRQVRSKLSKEMVDKLSYHYTGPWKVVEVLDGASYKLRHCISQRLDKKHASDLSPYPYELIPLVPLETSDNQFSQLYKKIREDPFLEAGIRGYEPPQPFQVDFLSADSSSLPSFHWPTLSELNDEVYSSFEPRPQSSSDGTIDMFREDQVDEYPLFYTGPPPSPPATNTNSPGTTIHTGASPPSLSDLVVSIIGSNDKLFFVSISIHASNVREWRLARVNLQRSTSLHSSCLQDGKFLMEFYTCHPNDSRYCAINQRHWLHYQPVDYVNDASVTSATHLVKPSDTSEAYAQRHHLVVTSMWLNINDPDVFIHGPFNFATINGRKSRDRIEQFDWDKLALLESTFQNKIPNFDMPSYSVHVDHHFHMHFPHIPIING